MTIARTARRTTAVEDSGSAAKPPQSHVQKTVFGIAVELSMFCTEKLEDYTFKMEDLFFILHFGYQIGFSPKRGRKLFMFFLLLFFNKRMKKRTTFLYLMKSVEVAQFSEVDVDLVNAEDFGNPTVKVLIKIG